MPAPSPIGVTEWREVAGARFTAGTDGRWTVVLSYEGATTGANSFIAAWPVGTKCPRVGFENLKMEVQPAVTDGVGGKSTARLTFTGLKDSGSEVSESYTEDWEAQFSSFVAQPGGTSTKGSYSYFHDTVIYSYASSSKRVATRFDPSVDDPEPHKLDEGGDRAKSVTDLKNAKDTDWEVVPKAGILHSGRDANGDWVTTEYHTKHLQRKLQ